MALWPAYMMIAGVLGAAGFSKLRAPGAAIAALGAVGVPAPRFAARALGIGEVALAGACAASPGRLAALVLAVAYLAFAGAVLRVRAARANGGCGCFGAEQAPAGLWHFGLDLAAAAVALAAAVAPPPGWGTVADHPAQLGLALAGIVVAVGLAKLAFTALPVAWSAYGAATGEGAAG